MKAAVICVAMIIVLMSEARPDARPEVPPHVAAITDPTRSRCSGEAAGPHHVKKWEAIGTRMGFPNGPDEKQYWWYEAS